MTVSLEKTSDEPATKVAEATVPAPLFGAGVTFAALPQDLNAMCVWDGDAVVCAPVTNDKG